MANNTIGLRDELLVKALALQVSIFKTHIKARYVTRVSVMLALLWQNGSWRQENAWELTGQLVWYMQQPMRFCIKQDGW